MKNREPHTPIMVKEVVSSFEGLQIRVFLDGTLGAGGHARAILEAHPEIERYIGCDKDPAALELARGRLSLWDKKVEYVHSDFCHLDRVLEEKGIREVNGFFLTLGCRLCS